MAKKTARSGSRRRSSAAGRKRASSKGRSQAPKVIRLKPLYNEISRVLKQLQKLQKRKASTSGLALLTAAGPGAPTEPDSIDLAIERLTQHQSDFRNICGPTMAIPAP